MFKFVAHIGSSKLLQFKFCCHLSCVKLNQVYSLNLVTRYVRYIQKLYIIICLPGRHTVELQLFLFVHIIKGTPWDETFSMLAILKI